MMALDRVRRIAAAAAQVRQLLAGASPRTLQSVGAALASMRPPA